jgi:hypothetical protein
MRKIRRWFLFFILLACGCTVPHYLFHQKDIGSVEINPSTLKNRILIASRDSEFKRELVDRLIAAYRYRDVYLKIIGINALKHENAKNYSAVVVLNTCMGWTVDVEVERFLEKYGAMDSIIVLTTSDGGDVLPDMQNRNIDAISSASVKDQIQPVADEMIGKINTFID